MEETTMKTVIAALALTALPLAGHAETLDVKTGAWEITTSTAMSGMPIPKEALDRMSPEQRAKVEASMRARGGAVKSHTSRTCVTREDLDRGDMQGRTEPNCKRKVLAQNARHLEIEQVCTGPEPSKSHFKFDATSNERYTGVIDMTRGDGKVHVDLSGRWLGATCTKGVDN
jgi:hypothetical protein